jgi:hypothetical protein
MIFCLTLRLAEARLLAWALRLSGGRGDQVSSLEANIAGRFLLSALLRSLVAE